MYLSAFLAAIISLGYKIAGIVTYDGRLQAFFNSPNYLAMYLAPALIIGIMLAQVQNSQPEADPPLAEKFKIKSYSSKLKILFLLFLLIILIALYFTFSYAAWFAIIISLAAVFLIKNKNISRRIIFLSDFSNSFDPRVVYANIFGEIK